MEFSTWDIMLMLKRNVYMWGHFRVQTSKSKMLEPCKPNLKIIFLLNFIIKKNCK